MNSKFARNSLVTIATATVVTMVGCAPAQPTIGQSPDADRWDPEAFLIEDARQSAELLRITDPPEVERVRFILPTENDEVWMNCMNEAGYAATPAPGGGFNFPDDISDEVHTNMMVALYTCWMQYPIDPKYFAPTTEEQDRWMYEYSTTTLIDCLEENGGEVLGTPPSFQVYVEQNGWSPFGDLSADSDVYYLQGVCLQTPPEFYEQPFW